MTRPYQDVTDAIDFLNVWSQGSFEVLRPLANGPTNESWLVQYKSQRYVLRKVKPLAVDLGLSLSAEKDVLYAAASAEIAPPLVASCTSSGLILSHFVEGCVWGDDDVNSPAQLIRLASTLRAVHQLECKVRPIDIKATLERYAKLSSDNRAEAWVMQALEQLDRVTRRTPVVCHNDLTAPNIIDSGRLVIIDWEYAALGDPLFDLAVIVSHHGLNASLTDLLLTTYLGENDSQAAADLELWCGVYQNTTSLWQSVVLSYDDDTA